MPPTATDGPIGPFANLAFMKDVAAYLVTKPSAEQKACLKQFIAELRVSVVTKPHFQTPLYLLVYTCDLMLTFSSDGRKLIDIGPPTVQ